MSNLKVSGVMTSLFGKYFGFHIPASWRKVDRFVLLLLIFNQQLNYQLTLKQTFILF